jgi:integrase
MGRVVKFVPKRLKSGKWQLNLPPLMSDTGKRKRVVFDTKEKALERADFMKDWHGSKLRGLARHASPEFILEALDCYEAAGAMGFDSLKAAFAAMSRDYEKRHSSGTFRELVTAFEADHKANWSKNYVAKRWGPFLSRLGELDDVPIGLQDTDYWRKWFTEWRKASSPSVATYNQTLGMIRALFGHEKARKSHAFNPLAPIPGAKETHAKTISISTPAEVNAILLWCQENDAALIPYFVLGYFAGMRPEAEIQHATFERINFATKTIDCRTTKTRKASRRHIPLEDAAAAWLAPFARRKGSIMVTNFRKRFDAARVGAAAALKLPEFPWGHDCMRHSYGSYWEASHRNEPGCREKLSYNMGHTSFKTFDQYYRNDRTEAEAKAYWSIMPTASEGVVSMVGA